MTKAQLISEIHFVTKTDTNTFADSDILTGLNLHQMEVIVDILRTVMDKNATGTMASTSLYSSNGLQEGDDGYNGQYAFPGDMLMPTRMEISYDGLTFVPVTLYDLVDNPNSELESDIIQKDFQPDKPAAFCFEGSFYIRPLKDTPGNIDGGVRMWYEQRQPELVDDNDTPTFPKDFHEILVYKGALRLSDREPTLYNARWDVKLAEIQSRMKDFYLKQFDPKNEQRTTATPLYEDYS